MGVVSRIEPFHIVRSQLRKSSSAGKLMIRVRIMNPCPSNGFSPVMNMWWPYTTALSAVTATIDSTVPRYQLAGLRLK